jgi:hypothetical protein
MLVLWFNIKSTKCWDVNDCISGKSIWENEWMN